MKTLKDIEYLQGVRVLVRVDFNVPVRDGVVVEDYRIRMALPTINFLRLRGAKVILISHIESPDGEKSTLEPVASALENLGVPVTFFKKTRHIYDAVHDLDQKTCVLLENLRQFPGEKENDKSFAEELASLADIYVNDAFSVSHRAHASVVGVPKLLPSYAGLQLEKEITNLSKAFKPAHPFVFILGGAKFDTKLPLLEKFSKSADTIFIGGALANDFFKAKKYEIGRSLTSDGDINLSKYLKDPKILIPKDIVNEAHETKDAESLSPEDKIMDAGSSSMEILREKIKTAGFVLWNGPLGLYEGGYQGATLELAKMIAESSEKRPPGQELISIVGGGDTLAAISTLGLQQKFTFVSTAGGAMLDFLAQGTLPGIDALC